MSPITISVSNEKDKKAVVWVSTVIYTLIGLSVVALMLAVVSPKIAEMKDSFVTSQTISALNELDGIITEIRQNVGSTRGYDLYLSKGEFKIHCVEGTLTQYIEWYLSDSSYMFSEATKPDEEPLVVTTGNIKGFTVDYGNRYAITLRLYYNELDLTFNGKDEDKTLQPAKTPYNLWLENRGVGPKGKQQIDISLL